MRGREDEEASRKLKSMDVEKLEKGAAGEDGHPPRPAVKYYGWRAMPFIIGTHHVDSVRFFRPAGSDGMAGA